MAKQKRPKAKTKQGELVLDEEQENKIARTRALLSATPTEMDRMYTIFGVEDESEIQDIINGHIGHDGY